LHKSLLSLKLGISLYSSAPKVIELKNLLPKSLDFNSVDYSVWGHWRIFWKEIPILVVTKWGTSMGQNYGLYLFALCTKLL